MDGWMKEKCQLDQQTAVPTEVLLPYTAEQY